MRANTWWLWVGVLILLSGCATHTELGGGRMGVTANWAQPEPGMYQQ